SRRGSQYCRDVSAQRPASKRAGQLFFVIARVSPPTPATFHYSRIAPFSGVMLPPWPQVGTAGRKHPTLLLGVPDEARNRAMLSSEALAAALPNLLSDPKECQRIGENCRAVADA